MSGGWAVTGQKTWVGAGRSPALIRATTRPRFLPAGLGLDGQGVADPVFQEVMQPQAAPPQKWRMGRSQAQVIRRRRDRLKGQPQECQHSAAAGGTRDRLPPARRSLSLREGSSPKGWDPASRSGPASPVSAASRARPAKPDAQSAYSLSLGSTFWLNAPSKYTEPM